MFILQLLFGFYHTQYTQQWDQNHLISLTGHLQTIMFRNSTIVMLEDVYSAIAIASYKRLSRTTANLHVYC